MMDRPDRTRTTQDFGEWDVLPEIDEDLPAAPMNSLPEKSRAKYEVVYNQFGEWRVQKNIGEVTQNALLAYFAHLATSLKSPSLWAKYSMLKATLIVNDNIDISKYAQLVAFLKRKAVGYIGNPAKTFTKEEIFHFFAEAPDEIYLCMKVALMMGIAGGLSRGQLTRMTVDDIDDMGSVLIVKIPDAKPNCKRTFIVTAETDMGLNLPEFYRKYAALRPPHTDHNRFFLFYKGGKCSKQVIGVNTFGKIPYHIATFLQLPDPNAYKDPNEWDIKPEQDVIDDEMKSKAKKYDFAYNHLTRWCDEKNIVEVTQNTLLAYFGELSLTMKSPTLWSRYSMLKTTLKVNDNIDVDKYSRLKAFLKRENVGYLKSETKTFTKDEIHHFLIHAPDFTYLMIKVALIIGISGGLTRDQLAHMTIDDIDDMGTILIFKLPEAKKDPKRIFIVHSQSQIGVDLTDFYRKYVALRPPNTDHRRLFLLYRGGKCSKHVIGVNALGRITYQVAEYLQLPDLDAYKGQSFRKYSAPSIF